MNSRLLIIRSPGRHGRALAANFELQRLRCLKVDGWELRRLAGPMVSELISDQCARASRQIVLELLAEVPIAASLGGIRPIPAQVDRRRRRHSRGGHDGAQCDTVKDGPVVGLRDPGPDGPHDRTATAPRLPTATWVLRAATPRCRNPTCRVLTMTPRCPPATCRVLVTPRCRTATCRALTVAP